MATIHAHKPTATDRSPGDRMWSSAFGAAALWHIVIIVLLASLSFHIRSTQPEMLETRWAELTSVDELKELENQPTVSLEPPNSGGDVAEMTSASGLIEQRPHVTISHAQTIVRSDLQITLDAARENLAERIPGEINFGFGDGAGKPGSFFGTQPNGKRFVFVVDRSLSMNHPHPSEARTRFRRVKLELLKSIANMSEDMYFYIIFFSDGPTPMPARSMQRATPEARQHFLNWMSTIPAGGQTEPRGALALALRLRPDVVYFLTDGSFTNKVQRELRQLVQKRSVIHTYAFGDPVGESLMKWIARANGGKYTFIP
jgi:hypothetical protein